MGQAKNRGNLEERKKQAIDKSKALIPDFLTCNNCGDKVSELFPLSTKGMKGIDIACTGVCTKCGRHTFGVSGDPESTEKAMIYFSTLESEGFTTGVEHINSTKD